MFFSVKTPTKITGKVYTPCVCYPLPDILKPTIEKMVNEDKAYIYDCKVAFQNGRVLKKVEKEAVDTKPADTKKSKKTKKEDTKEEDDIPSPEEIADNVEDF